MNVVTKFRWLPLKEEHELDQTYYIYGNLCMLLALVEYLIMFHNFYSPIFDFNSAFLTLISDAFLIMPILSKWV